MIPRTLKSGKNFLIVLLLLAGLASCEEMFSKITGEASSGSTGAQWLDITGTNTSSMHQLNETAVTDTQHIAIGKSSYNLYAAWIESSIIKVKQFSNDEDNPQWYEYSAGLVYTAPGGGLHLSTYNDQLHIAYCDNGKVIVMYLDEYSGQWYPLVDTAMGVGNLMPTASPVLVEFQNTLYVLFRHVTAPTYLRMFRHDGGNMWTEIADSASPAEGVNGNSNDVTFGPSVAVAGDRLYIAYTEYTTTDKLKIRPFNGFDFDTPDINNGNFNFWNTGDQDQQPSIIAASNEIYVGWQQMDSSLTQSRYSVFKRMSDSNWYSIDNGYNGFPQGIREMDSNNLNLLKTLLVPINGRVCALAADEIYSNPGTATAWAKIYNGEQDGGYHDWLWAGIEVQLDEYTAQWWGINYYTSNGWVDNLNAVEFNSNLFVIYLEGSTLYAVKGK